jgi:3-hydroxyacyl-CoA dehydrogenase/3a,7a,12a-trihydroxy-5b-cholest-24-enoyl-CoA hydratase
MRRKLRSFASTVIPGETLITEMWKESDTKIIFRTKVKERGETVISNAAIELWKELPKAKDRSKPAAAAAGGAPKAVTTSADIFRAIGTFVGGKAQKILAPTLGDWFIARSH